MSNFFFLRSLNAKHREIIKKYAALVDKEYADNDTDFENDSKKDK